MTKIFFNKYSQKLVLNLICSCAMTKKYFPYSLSMCRLLICAEGSESDTED